MLAEFRGFLTKTNAMALAVGVIIGAAVGNVVTALVSDILMPVLGIFLPGGDWREARFVLERSTDASGKLTESAILYGHFLGAVLDFVVISLVVFLVVRALIKPAPENVGEPLENCPECRELIPVAARRCRACTSILPQ